MGLFDTIGRWFGGPPEPPPAPPAAALGPQPDFPFPLVTVHGNEALATWTKLRAAGEGYPVIIGPDEDIAYLREGITHVEERSAETLLAAAAPLTFPASLQAKRAEDNPEASPELGTWPDHIQTTDLTVIAHYTGRIYDRVHIAILPCTNGWEAIAHLRWGGWNENPSAEYHVAALKSWHERYGADLIGCSHDVLNLRVARRPATRDEALALARQQYLYCNDVVDQGAETLSNLAAVLMASDWWFFWWD